LGQRIYPVVSGKPLYSTRKREEIAFMRSKFAFGKMTLPVLILCLLFVFSACGGGKAVKSGPVAKSSGMSEVREVKQ
jgi:hypothetical protein